MLCDVSYVAVDGEVVGHVSPAQVVAQFEEEKLPGQAGEEGVVHCVREASHQLADYRQDEQELPTMFIRPGACQQGVTDPGGVEL